MMIIIIIIIIIQKDVNPSSRFITLHRILQGKLAFIITQKDRPLLF